jgi:AcrR family transcriptional regulator
MLKALERRNKLRESLIMAAEQGIAARGLAGLTTRELAREIGCANGAVYNLVEDMDELVLRVASRTLARLDAVLTDAEAVGTSSPGETLVLMALAYCDFATRNIELWRALFEHRMAPDKALPAWAVDQQTDLFRHIYRPLAKLFPAWPATELGLTARGLFSSVHGMVALGLERRFAAVPIEALRSQIALIVRATVAGLAIQQ